MISRPRARALRTVLAAAALLAFASSRSHRIALRAALRASDSGADSLNLRSFSSVEARRRPFRHVVRARVAAAAPHARAAVDERRVEGLAARAARRG